MADWLAELCFTLVFYTSMQYVTFDKEGIMSLLLLLFLFLSLFRHKKGNDWSREEGGRTLLDVLRTQVTLQYSAVLRA